MEVVNLLKFLNIVQDLYALDYNRCNRELTDLLDLMSEDEQFVRSIDLGIIFVNRKSIDQYIIVDGLSRILSLSLLLHAVCECYKKTSSKNAKAIKTIRSKYLFNADSKLKINLHPSDAELYAKLINGDRLSSHEKSKPIFLLLHNYWLRIKNENFQAADIFKMLQKIKVTVVETQNISKRDLYYKLNSDKRSIDQIALIENYLKEKDLSFEWESMKESYCVEKDDMLIFLMDFLITKFNYKNFTKERLYENFVNYFETMKQYISTLKIMDNIRFAAMLYNIILNINFENKDIKKAFMDIRRHDGEDTFAYILSVYEDVYKGNISEQTFLEILTTIDEYLKNRQTSGKNIDFNQLVQYLNALITCK